jgi:hypothetical protein
MEREKTMKCPRQDSTLLKFDAIFEAPCPKCGQAVEFFKDETRRRCKKCGHQVLNPKMDFGCAAHCKFAEHCFGELPPELIKEKQDLFKDRVAVEMKLYFKQDFKRIGHAARVARYAERLVQVEKGDPAVALSAAYLHDIGIKKAEEKHQSTESQYQEQEGPDGQCRFFTKLRCREPRLTKFVTSWATITILALKRLSTSRWFTMLMCWSILKKSRERRRWSAKSWQSLLIPNSLQTVVASWPAVYC